MTQKGSFTVEAVFIVPIVSYIILLFLYLNFYLYDYSCMVSYADYLLEEYRHTSNRDLLEYESIRDTLNENLWFSSVETIDVIEERFKVKLVSELFLDLPQNGLFGIFSIFEFRNMYEKEILLIDRTETARVLTVGIEFISKIKGVNQVIEKYFNQ